MGCCKSSQSVDASRLQSNIDDTSSPLNQTEMMELETLLVGVPDHCRGSILNLPVRRLLHFHQYHMMAIYHALGREWQTALSYEHQAITGLKALLPNDTDHYIFFDIYNILATCFVALGELPVAIEGTEIALAILLKHTPTDHKQISITYCRLADVYKSGQQWKAAATCLTKAIAIARLSNADREFIATLEADIQSIKERIVNEELPNFTVRIDKPKCGESSQDSLRRLTAELVAFNAEHGSLSFDKAEFERLPDKQTESQVTDEILEDVLKHLKNHINHDLFGCGMHFIAAQFKNAQMPTSPLSAAVIEAALTMIIDRTNNVNTTNDEQYTVFKQASVSFSYTHDSLSFAKGVRVFIMERKEESS